MTDDRRETLAKLELAAAKMQALTPLIGGSIEGATLAKRAAQDVTEPLRQALAELREDMDRDGL